MQLFKLAIQWTLHPEYNTEAKLIMGNLDKILIISQKSTRGGGEGGVGTTWFGSRALLAEESRLWQHPLFVKVIIVIL